MTGAPFPDIAAWPPTRYTPPLSPVFPSAFDRWAKVFAVAWVCAFDYALESWQIETIRAILEIDPATGALRWQQAVVSLARQNGKTELAAALGLWMLLARRSPLIVGIASSKEQADLVYRRTMQAIERNPELAEMFARLTDTRGIQTLDGGQYVLKAAKSAALQGLPLDLGLVDELHLLRRALWGDLVSGTGGRRDCIVVGITTAGDADSELLIDLYSLGEGSISDDGANRVFFAAWEAPEPRVPEDDETLGRWLAMSNPRIANGGRDLPGLITLVRTKPEPDAIRYHLNRFLESVRAPYIPAAKWREAARPEGVPFPSSSMVFALDSAPGMAFVSITATARDAAGVLHTELVASLRAPTFDQLLAIVDRLAEYGPRTFAVDGYTLGRVGKEMQRRGYPVLIGSRADTLQAAALLFRLIVTGMCQHSGDALLAVQIPRAIRKNVGEAFRISRASSAVEVDAVIATALGVLAAEVTPESESLGVF